jgi:hypothetical protein
MPGNKTNKREESVEKPSITLPGTVEKVIPGAIPAQPDKAQISVEGAEPLYKEIRVENALQDDNGIRCSSNPAPRSKLRLKPTSPRQSPKSAEKFPTQFTVALA